MFPYFSKTRHDHATLDHSDIINSDLIHTLITSYIRANIYRFIYSTCLSKHYQKHTHQSHIYIFIYIHSPIKVIPALEHTKSSISNHTIREFNNQSWVTYISLCREPIQISTVQIEEHVVKPLPKFNLNRTVNDTENAVLRKLRRPEKLMVPSA